MRRIFYLLGVLNDDDVDWLSQNGSVVATEPGFTLIHAGNRIDQLYIVLDGKMDVRSSTGQAIATLYPGDVIGEMSFVDSRPPSATVVAVVPSLVLAIQRSDLEDKLQRDVEFSARFYFAIARFLADRLYVSMGRFGYGPVGQASDVDELPEEYLQLVDLAAVRFDDLLRRLKTGA